MDLCLILGIKEYRHTVPTGEIAFNAQMQYLGSQQRMALTVEPLSLKE
jgi:hypothetical protein